MIIGGDFNARAAEEGSVQWNMNDKMGEEAEEENEKRKSKDKKLNRQGMDMLDRIEEIGLGIKNRNMQSVEKGEWTFMGDLGQSVIDYGICNVEAWEEIFSMKIGERADSDHRPTEVTLQASRTEAETSPKRRYIDDWMPEGQEEYRQKLKERREKAEGTAQKWEELKEEIKKAVNRKEVAIRKKMPGKRKWWGREYRVSKKILNCKLRNMIKGKVERKDFFESKATLRQALP